MPKQQYISKKIMYLEYIQQLINTSRLLIGIFFHNLLVNTLILY